MGLQKSKGLVSEHKNCVFRQERVPRSALCCGVFASFISFEQNTKKQRNLQNNFSLSPVIYKILRYLWHLPPCLGRFLCGWESWLLPVAIWNKEFRSIIPNNTHR